MSNERSALVSSFVADALSLGSHWVYNQDKLARAFPDGVRAYSDPLTKYHPNRRAGGFTHYGDQALTLLRSLALRGGWDADGFRNDWTAMWDDYDGYVDGATKDTLANHREGTARPSTSNDLAGASRIGPVLLATKSLPLEQRVAAARAQTALTHGDGMVIDAAEYFVRACDAVSGGKSVVEALEWAAGATYRDLPARDWLAQARDSSEDDLQAAAGFGLTCHIPEAFPATLLFLLRYPGDLMEALSQNTLAGGDTSARAMLIALVLGMRPEAPPPPPPRSE